MARPTTESNRRGGDEQYSVRSGLILLLRVPGNIVEFYPLRPGVRGRPFGEKR
jgi:hypothetical protein